MCYIKTKQGQAIKLASVNVSYLYMVLIMLNIVTQRVYLN